MTREEWIAWLRHHIGVAEKKGRAGHHVITSLRIVGGAPRFGRRISSHPSGGGIYEFTLDDLWALLGRALRQQEAEQIAGEATAA